MIENLEPENVQQFFQKMTKTTDQLSKQLPVKFLLINYFT